ncbi:MAG: hypothetical protein ACUVT9_02850 [Candidatus Bathycorpusculaceae bacterium]
MSLEPVGKAYSFKTLTGDCVYIGDPNDEVFHPKLRLERWKGECWLKLCYDDTKVAGKEKSCKLEENKVKWSCRDFDFHFYALNVSEQNEGGGLEFEIILKTKPPVNTFTLPFQSQNLLFYFQPPLTQRFKPEDCIVLSETFARLKDGREIRRPINVVGSYAVYHATRTNIHYSQTDAEKYKVGKAFHIYRPMAKDNVGNNVWCDLNIDEAEGVLTITVPQEFLDKAVYPIVVDPTFGYTTKGGTDYHNPDHYSDGSVFTCPEAGIGESITMYLKQYGSLTPNLAFLIYQHSNNALVKETEEWTVTSGWDGWKTLNFPSPKPSLTAQDYVLLLWHSDSVSFYADDNGADKEHYWWNITYNYDNPPNPAWFAHGSIIVSIYCTYTVGAILKTWSALLNVSHVLTRPLRFMKLTQSLNLSHVLTRNRFMRLTHALQTLHTWTLPLPTFLKQWFATLQTAHTFRRPQRQIGYVEQLQTTHVFGRPVRLIRLPATLQLTDVFARPHRFLRLLEQLSLEHIYFVAVPSVKKTKLFLVIGDITIQLSRD